MECRFAGSVEREGMMHFSFLLNPFNFLKFLSFALLSNMRNQILQLLNEGGVTGLKYRFGERGIEFIIFISNVSNLLYHPRLLPIMNRIMHKSQTKL